jgi:type III secretory pathway lipoprotein EscJ
VARLFLFCIIIFFSSGCAGNELLSDLDQQQSAEIMVVLHRSGIVADRVVQTSGRIQKFRLLVHPKDYYRALEIIHEYGLPAKREADLAELTRQDGFVPNSQEMENVRLSIALAAQVERLISALPGVIDVRAFVDTGSRKGSMLVRDRQETRLAGASIVIRYTSKDRQAMFSIDDVKHLVSSAIDGLNPENVLVQLTFVNLSNTGGFFGVDPTGGGEIVTLARLLPFLFTFKVPESERPTARTQLAALGMLAVLFAVIVGFWVGWRKGKRDEGLKRRRQNSSSNVLLDGSSASNTRVEGPDITGRIVGGGE